MPQIVEGLSETLQMLQDAPKQVAILGMGRAGRAAITLIAAALAKRTPIGDGPTRGELVSALFVEEVVDTQGRGITARVGFKGKQATVAMSLEYGHWWTGHAPEFKREDFIAEVPFMRPVFDATASAAIQMFEDTLEAELRTIYGG
jgi:hypothetical protein